VYKETGRGKRRWKAHELFADQRCAQALLDFLASTDVGKVAPAAEEEAGSEASEGELRERTEREQERRAEEEALGAVGEATLFLPNIPFMARAGED